MTDQPTLTDGTVTLRPWRDEDVEPTHAGHDEQLRHWFGEREKPTLDDWRTVVHRWRGEHASIGRISFVVDVEDEPVGTVELRPVDEHTGELSYWLYDGHRGQGWATRAVRVVTDWALTSASEGGRGFTRVQALVEPGNESSLRVATRSGLRREGIRRVAPGTGDRAETEGYVVLARLATDPPLTDPSAFRSLLNSFLPRKRAIGQMLIRDAEGPDARVLLCRLTYKNDWDLPGGVVEVGESPQLAAGREVTEELALDIPSGRLLLTDWLPPWGGWDDALCLVFDGGVHPATVTERIVPQAREIREAAFLTPDEIAERCADFTARRITAALANLGGGPAYTESGRSSQE
ncbi:GNAT family N-acetyltransferase [Nocardioides sp.]|uniref:NUDIX hydrolase n=1 Tax=Nocardioides sp. TaxID=35761 RepID=UPI0027216C4B|nr:GNAT family N-acetyltransferase [Nocardioides sp.]MDO9455749.1 GNAT family N-acetyltransferase [Nocardioides sp.]